MSHPTELTQDNTSSQSNAETVVRSPSAQPDTQPDSSVTTDQFDATNRAPGDLLAGAVRLAQITAIRGPNEAGRYTLHGELARGGMGVVLLGRDTELGRELAVKVLLEHHRDRPEVLRRFIEEAQIAGQLQHPGVVPVYDLGMLDDKRPFFAMKLVRGRTLADLLRERATSAEALPRFLGIFEHVAQAVGYAHSKSVIHRDLKPSNVMVGAFGEVQVMDWGLAKTLRSDDAPADGGGGGHSHIKERARI